MRAHPEITWWVLGIWIALAIVGLWVTYVDKNVARKKRLLPANLTPASRRQNHTTSPSASAALVSRSLRVHRIPPRVRDDREPPLLSGETGELVALICPTGM